MTNWKNIHLDFTPELKKEWIEKGFSYEKCKEWINVGLKANDAGFAQWLKDKKKISAEKFFDCENTEQLRKDYVDSRDDPHPTNFQIIQNIKDNPQNWRIDEVITEYNNLGKAAKKELALIHKSAQISKKGEVFGSIGCLEEKFSWHPIHLLTQRFNQEEITEIKRVISNSDMAKIEVKFDAKLAHKDKN